MSFLSSVASSEENPARNNKKSMLIKSYRRGLRGRVFWSAVGINEFNCGASRATETNEWPSKVADGRGRR